MKKDIIEIEKRELRALLFWAVTGLCDSNGGSGDKLVIKCLDKYYKAVNMNRDNGPMWGLNIVSSKIVDGEQYLKTIKVFEKYMPRTVFPKKIKLAQHAQSDTTSNQAS